MLVTVFPVIFITACSSGKISKETGETNGIITKGRYNLILHDSTDNFLLELELNVRAADSSVFSGSTKITKTYSENFKGYQNISRSRNFTGRHNVFDKNTVTINLNPGTEDSNIFITLNTVSNKTGGDEITGKWSFSTFTGVINTGRVSLGKQK
jgi:hypothetical protein